MAYSGDDAVYRYIRKIMALPFLPYREILPMFIRLEAQAQTEELVSDNKLKRIQRSVTRNIQAKLLASWEKYENNEKTAAQLLKTCSRLNGPARTN